jgi:hypothetical protein
MGYKKLSKLADELITTIKEKTPEQNKLIKEIQKELCR